MRAIGTSWIALLGVVICLVMARSAMGDELADFERAMNYYDHGQYAEAAGRFRGMLDASNSIRDASLREKVRIYLAACLIADGRGAEADTQIEVVLRANPSAQPGPTFPVAVGDRFAEVRARIRGEIEANELARIKKEEEARQQRLRAQEQERMRIVQLELLARQETHVAHHSRWIAALPLGVGQFQNGQAAAGWLFLGTELALAATTIVTAVNVQSLESNAFEPNVDRDHLNNQVRQAALFNRAAFATLTAVAIAGVAHAQFTFVPYTKTVRARTASQSRILPGVSLLPSGGILGIQASF